MATPSRMPTGGSAIGLSATDAWIRAAAGDGWTLHLFNDQPNGLARGLRRNDDSGGVHVVLIESLYLSDLPAQPAAGAHELIAIVKAEKFLIRPGINSHPISLVRPIKQNLHEPHTRGLAAAVPSTGATG